MDRQIGDELVTASRAQVLHECVPSRDDGQRGDRFQPAHRAKPRFEPTLVGLHRSRAESLRAGEECPGGCTIPTFRDQNVVDLTMLIDRAVKTNRSGVIWSAVLSTSTKGQATSVARPSLAVTN